MAEQESQPTRWYDKKWLVVLLLFVFFPVGLYALYKGDAFGTVGTVVVTILFLFVLINVVADPDDLESPSTEPQQSNTDQAVQVVANHIGGENKLNIDSGDLRGMENPRGEGAIVYVPQTRFYGVQRYVVWVVADEKAFALNSPSKMTTPSLPWPREAHYTTWSKTGFDTYGSASEVIDIVFER